MVSVLEFLIWLDNPSMVTELIYYMCHTLMIRKISLQAWIPLLVWVLHTLELPFKMHFSWDILTPLTYALFYISKYWIGNERKRRGLATKRGPRDSDNGAQKYVLGKKRKKSGYSVFKSAFLSSEKGTCSVYVYNYMLQIDLLRHILILTWMLLHLGIGVYRC